MLTVQSTPETIKEKVKCIDGLPCLSFRQLSRPLATNEVEAQERSDHVLSWVLEGLLLDAYRPGKPATFSSKNSSK
jgi:hypothetical protein